MLQYYRKSGNFRCITLMHTVRGRLQRKLFYTKLYPTKYFQRENFAIYGISYYCTILSYRTAAVSLPYCTTVLLYYTTVSLHALLYYCTTVLLYYCTTALLYYCTTVLLYYCTTALLYHCLSVLLYHCLTVPLPYCNTVLLYYCINALLLYYCTTVLLSAVYHYTIIYIIH